MDPNALQQLLSAHEDSKTHGTSVPQQWPTQQTGFLCTISALGMPLKLGQGRALWGQPLTQGDSVEAALGKATPVCSGSLAPPGLEHLHRQLLALT